MSSGEVPIIGLAYIPTLGFWAQGAKRRYDMGQSGWFQIIRLCFGDDFASGKGINKYGVNPKASFNALFPYLHFINSFVLFSQTFTESDIKTLAEQVTKN